MYNIIVGNFSYYVVKKGKQNKPSSDNWKKSHDHSPWLPWGTFCWKGGTAGYKQSRRFFECVQECLEIGGQ